MARAAASTASETGARPQGGRGPIEGCGQFVATGMSGEPGAAQTILHAFIHAGSHLRDVGVTLMGPEGTVCASQSYAELLQTAMQMAGNMAQRGVRAGQRVALVLPTGMDMLAGLFATQLLGAVPVPITAWAFDDLSDDAATPQSLAAAARQARLGGLTNQQALAAGVGAGPELAARVRRVVHDSSAVWCMTQQSLQVGLGQLVFDCPGLCDFLLVERLCGDGAPHLQNLQPPVRRDAAVVLYSGGTTGSPRGVVLQHGNVLAALAGLRKWRPLETDTSDRVLVTLPVDHPLGLIAGVYYAIWSGVPCVLAPPAMAQLVPQQWRQAVQTSRSTFTAMTVASLEACVAPSSEAAEADAEKSAKPLAGLRDVVVWGESLVGARVVAMQHRWSRFGGQADALWAAYGLCETGGLVALGRLAATGAQLKAHSGHLSRVPLDTVLAKHVVRVIDASGQAVPDGVLGQLVVRGPAVMAGYACRPERTRDAIRNGWLRTGDLGVSQQGAITVWGRSCPDAKDGVGATLAGTPPALHQPWLADIRAAAAATVGVRLGAVCAFTVEGAPSNIMEEAPEDAVRRRGRPPHQEPHQSMQRRWVVVAETPETDVVRSTADGERVASHVEKALGLRLWQVHLFQSGTLPRTPWGDVQRSLCRSGYSAGTLDRLESPAWGHLRRAWGRVRGVSGVWTARLRGRSPAQTSPPTLWEAPW